MNEECNVCMKYWLASNILNYLIAVLHAWKWKYFFHLSSTQLANSYNNNDSFSSTPSQITHIISISFKNACSHKMKCALSHYYYSRCSCNNDNQRSTRACWPAPATDSTEWRPPSHKGSLWRQISIIFQGEHGSQSWLQAVAPEHYNIYNIISNKYYPNSIEIVRGKDINI